MKNKKNLGSEIALDAAIAKLKKKKESENRMSDDKRSNSRKPSGFIGADTTSLASKGEKEFKGADREVMEDYANQSLKRSDSSPLVSKGKEESKGRQKSLDNEKVKSDDELRKINEALENTKNKLKRARGY